MTDFHWNNGWHFERLDNGDVDVTKRLPVQERVWIQSDTYPQKLKPGTRGHASAPSPDDEVLPIPGAPHVVVERFTIPAPEWASIIASMSAIGETTETYDFATALHAGDVIITMEAPER